MRMQGLVFAASRGVSAASIDFAKPTALLRLRALRTHAFVGSYNLLDLLLGFFLQAIERRLRIHTSQLIQQVSGESHEQRPRSGSTAATYGSSRQRIPAMASE